VGGYYLDYDINREEAARYGLTVGDVQDVIQSAVGGMNVTYTVEGLERYPVNLRYPRELRDNPEALKRVFIPTPSGTHIPLSLVADLQLRRGPPGIKSENSRLNSWIYVDIKTSDIGGYVARAKQAVAEAIRVPPGYTIAWSGQFEYMERAAKRLQIVIPFTLLIIFLLLYFNFRNVSEPLAVMLSIPFALIGGLWLIYWLGYNLSVAVAVGFIALAGVAAEIGVLVLTFIDQEMEKRRQLKAAERFEQFTAEEIVPYADLEEKQRRQKLRTHPAATLTPEEVMAAVQSGTAERVRPVVMTATAIIAGLLPIMWGSGTGSEVMQRIAAPMVGGMVTTTLLCLLVLPIVYGLILQYKERHRRVVR